MAVLNLKSKTRCILMDVSCRESFAIRKSFPFSAVLSSKTEVVEPSERQSGFILVGRWARYRRVIDPYTRKAYYFLPSFMQFQGQKPILTTVERANKSSRLLSLNGVSRLRRSIVRLGLNLSQAACSTKTVQQGKRNPAGYWPTKTEYSHSAGFFSLSRFEKLNCMRVSS